MSTTARLKHALLVPLLALLVIGCVTDESGYVDRVSTPLRPAQGAHGTGVFLGGTSIRDYETWLGRPVTHVGGYAAGDTWANFEHSRFRHWRGSGKQLVVGVPILMKQQPGGLAAGAAGAYDEHFRTFGRNLVEDGQGNAVLRLGWEFNGHWFAWRADRDPEAFARYWRRIVTAMRSIPGSSFRFDWNPDMGPVDPRTYPGDAYVDVIGFDVYDRTYGPALRDPVVRWNDFVNRPYGLNWLRTFAAAHGKPMSFPEWAVTRDHVSGVVHDNPVFIRGMTDFIRSNDVEYTLYFDVRAHDGDFRIARFPRSAAAYRATSP